MVRCPSCHSENADTVKFCGECGTPLPSTGSQASIGTETFQTPIHELSTGSTFAGRYQIIEELGHGGMGRVYKVFDTDIKEKIALKLLRPEIALDKETVERFSNELKLARKISHRNVCRMFDLGKAEGTTFITMEFVPGQDLKRLIRQTGQLGVGRAVSIVQQVCDGLAEAHHLGVVHRDLKPQNIMVDEDGNARIMDFGIARSLRGKGITGAGVMIGTPEYMSPEQVEGKDVDQRADIYSLGIILYEMLTGHVPFEGDTPFAVGVKQKSEPPRAPRELNAQIPADLDRLVLKCLEKDRAKRYESAADLQTDLDRIEQGLPTTERAASKPKPFTSREIMVKFQPRKLIAPTLAVLAVIAGAVLFWPKKASNLDPKIVAVAVFENRTGDAKLEYIGNMAAERIMQGLTQIGEFSVAPMPSPEALAGESKAKGKIRALADLTKAGKIVHGDYYLQGENIQFHAWVEDMVGEKNIVALEPVIGPSKDPAAALEPLRLKLMGGLAGVFEPAMKDWLSVMKEPPNYAAYRECVESIKTFLRGDYSQSIEQGLRAMELDPKLNAMRLMVSIAYYNRGQYAEAEKIVQELAKSRSQLSILESLFLDHELAVYHGDHEAALRTARQIISINRGWGWVYENALVAEWSNYPREAADLLKSLDPYDENYRNWAGNYWGVLTAALHMLGDHRQELRDARRGRKQVPESLSRLDDEIVAVASLDRMRDLQRLFEESRSLPPREGFSPGDLMLGAGRELRAHGFKDDSLRVLNQALQWLDSRPDEEKASRANRSARAKVFYGLGRYDEAKALFEKLQSEAPDNPSNLGYLGVIAGRKGDKDGAQKASKQFEENKQPFLFGLPAYWRARIAAVLGDKEGAVSLLRVAIQQGYSYADLHPCQDFESLADYPPYIELMKPKG